MYVQLRHNISIALHADTLHKLKTQNKPTIITTVNLVSLSAKLGSSSSYIVRNIE